MKQYALISGLCFLLTLPLLAEDKKADDGWKTIFDGKSLDGWLRDRGIDHVIVTGIRTEQCCETTARHASDSGFQVTYAIDATHTFPMVSKSGRTYTVGDIMERTALVLDDRFAKVVSAAEVFV